MMAISRRHLFKLFGAGLTASLFPVVNSAFASVVAQPFYLSAFSDNDDNHFIGLVNHTGSLVRQWPVPARGHGAAVLSSGRWVAFFSRRPGLWLTVVDIRNEFSPVTLQPSQGRHWYGHGVFSHDSNLLYTSENDYDNDGRGVIGVYAVSTSGTACEIVKVNEFSSHGVGPHELALMDDGKTLVVANGGIQTHPDYARMKLNLDSMRSTVSFIDVSTGKLLAEHAAPKQLLSLRHLSLVDDGVIVGAQYQGNPQDSPMLVYKASQRAGLVPFTGQPAADLAACNQYIASVATSPSGSYAVTTAPRGNRVSIWSLENNTWLYDMDAFDVGGAAFSVAGENVMLSSGDGSIKVLDIKTRSIKELSVAAGLHWDNHLQIFG